MTDSIMQVQDGAGSAAYSPANTQPDNAIILQTRSTRASAPNAAPGDVTVIDGKSLLPPDPTVGGEPGQMNRLGFSTGFLAFRRFSAFTGRMLTGKPMGVNPKTGNVGYSTRSQRLRNGVQALATDYTPSSQEVAREIVENT